MWMAPGPVASHIVRKHVAGKVENEDMAQRSLGFASAIDMSWTTALAPAATVGLKPVICYSQAVRHRKRWSQQARASQRAP